MFYIQKMRQIQTINVLVREIYIVRIILEKLAYRQNSECCKADF